MYCKQFKFKKKLISLPGAILKSLVTFLVIDYVEKDSRRPLSFNTQGGKMV